MARAGSDAAVGISKRTSDLITKGPGVNITPKSLIDAYPTIGRGGRTFVTDMKAVEDIIGSLQSGEKTITVAQARQLEQALGLRPNSLEAENVITLVDDIAGRAPAAPTGIPNANGTPSVNPYFLGAGKGLPGGGPELTVDGVSSFGLGYGGTSPAQQILLRVHQ
jgi:hypothetical protein